MARKNKTCKSVAKRVKVTGKGKLKRGRAGGRHLMASKTGKRARQLRKSALVAKADLKKMRTVLGM